MTNSLEASIDIAATPQEVWRIVSDLERMSEWSPQCRGMKVFGDVRAGAWTLNINRKGLLVWPTTSKVVRFEPNKAIAFRVTENRTVWSYILEPTAAGTKVVERRDAPHDTAALSKLLIKNVLGGTDEFEAELVDGMNSTLSRIKSEAENR